MCNERKITMNQRLERSAAVSRPIVADGQTRSSTRNVHVHSHCNVRSALLLAHARLLATLPRTGTRGCPSAGTTGHHHHGHRHLHHHHVHRHCRWFWHDQPLAPSLPLCTSTKPFGLIARSREPRHRPGLFVFWLACRCTAIRDPVENLMCGKRRGLRGRMPSPAAHTNAAALRDRRSSSSPSARRPWSLRSAA